MPLILSYSMGRTLIKVGEDHMRVRIPRRRDVWGSLGGWLPGMVITTMEQTKQSKRTEKAGFGVATDCSWYRWSVKTLLIQNRERPEGNEGVVLWLLFKGLHPGSHFGGKTSLSTCPAYQVHYEALGMFPGIPHLVSESPCHPLVSSFFLFHYRGHFLVRWTMFCSLHS